MKAEEVGKIEDALKVLKDYESQISRAVDKAVLLVFNEDNPEIYTETFDSEKEFMDRFLDDERDCEGFSWVLWNEGRYNRLSGNGCYYQLIKIKDIL